MEDLFNQRILCNNCNKEMQKGKAQKDGYTLRALQCISCNKRIYHPADLEELKQFQKLKNKEFKVKLRLVGNSYIVSIPKEIIHYQEDLQKDTTEIIKMYLEEPEKLSIFFSKRIRRFY
ncbi:hypothetical protein HY500_00995 [Candidatus Woesearchaeota archaeon]|nr:hypothetical protein [Candidatus Woesearchaeota archaeon]